MRKSKLALRAETVRTLASRDLAVARGGLPGISLDSDCWRCTSAIMCPRPSIDIACPTTGNSARGCTFD